MYNRSRNVFYQLWLYMLRFKLIYLLVLVTPAFGQEFTWDMLNSDNSQLPNQTIKSITFDQEGTMWVGTYMGGIATFDGTDWNIYNTSNSDLPHNYVNAIAVDKDNVKWIGTDGGGLARFDGTSWEVYKTSNSGIPSNVVMSIFCDDDGTIWVGTYFGGLAKLNSGIWEIFNDENSPLLSNKIVCITKDKKGLIWLGTQGGGVASFDGKNWNVYTERNSKLANDYIYSIAVDDENKKWIGTGGGGIAVFNDVFWIKYNSSNADLTDDNIRPIVIDPKQNIWIGTYIGGINIFDGKTWKVYDFQNSPMPDDEITCMAIHQDKVMVGTERSGIIGITDQHPLVVPIVTAVKEGEGTTKEGEIAVPAENTNETALKVADTLSQEEVAVTPQEDTTVVALEIEPEVQQEVKPAVVTLKPTNRIVLVMDAADVYFDNKKLKQTLRSFKYLLKNREKVNSSYEVKLLIYSTNYDINPKKIVIEPKDLEEIMVKPANIVYLEGESTFTEGIQKAFNLIKEDYNLEGNNHVIAATYKFIRDDETAKVVVKNNLDNHYIVFSLLAFKSDSWKLEHKMRSIVPKGGGHYYSITLPGIKDNWSFTGQVGMTIFRGDMDVSKSFAFPGVFGFAANKQVISTGILNGGVKAQFNFGKMTGNKNSESFENNYKEACINFQVILNKWFKRNFRFEKFRPYAFAGIGIINYRALLKNSNGEVVDGVGYDVTADSMESNGTNPAKTKSATELMIPLGMGINYKVNDQINIEGEVSSRYINSDKLDAKDRYKDDKYWFFSIGLTYKINTKKFLSDILSK